MMRKDLAKMIYDDFKLEKTFSLHKNISAWYQRVLHYAIMSEL